MKPDSTLRQGLVAVLDSGGFELPDHYLDELVAVVEDHCDAASATSPDCGGVGEPCLAAENERLRLALRAVAIELAGISRDALEQGCDYSDAKGK